MPFGPALRTAVASAKAGPGSFVAWVLPRPLRGTRGFFVRLCGRILSSLLFSPLARRSLGEGLAAATCLRSLAALLTPPHNTL